MNTEKDLIMQYKTLKTPKYKKSTKNYFYFEIPFVQLLYFIELLRFAPSTKSFVCSHKFVDDRNVVSPEIKKTFFILYLKNLLK